jgi:hypothetical protein
VNAGQRPEPAECTELLGHLLVQAERDLPAGRHALHRERLMRQIDLDTPPALPTRPRRRRRLMLPLVGVLAAGAAAAAVVVTHYSQGASGPLSSAELASWTSTPMPLNPATSRGASAEQWCLDRMKDAPGAGAPATITNADFRGQVASMVINRGGNAMFCLVASDTSGMWEVIDPVKTTAADAITFDTGGSHGDGASAFNYAEGSVGASVTAITFHDGGRTFRVTVQDRRWTAWWPGATGGVPSTLTLTLANGTTRTVTGDSLFPQQ